MKNFIKNNILTIILILIIIIFGSQFYNQLKKANRYQDNFEQLLHKSNNKIMKLTKAEFKRLQKQQNDTLFKHLKDSLKLSYRHIEKTITHKYAYTYDTTITKLLPASSGIKTFNQKFDDCLSISGKVDYNQDLLIFEKPEINYSATSVYYWKRKHKFLGIQFGRKQHYVETKNNCNGETTVTEIQIIKK